MPTAENPLWHATYPETWVMETDGDSVVLFDPDNGVGTLEISCFCTDEPTSEQDLLDLAADVIANGAQRMDVNYADTHGLMFVYREDDTAWKEWYLATENCVFFVTYDCPEEFEGAEDDELITVIESLRLNR